MARLYGRKFFVTTPIFYVNASPHMGHLYTAVIADAVHRLKILQGSDNTIFSTGTDEHGVKIQQAAEKNNMHLPEYCTEVSSQYKSLFSTYNISFTDFVRTTDSRHLSAVQSFWEVLRKNGFLYRGKYTGWYCVSDESFLSGDQLLDAVQTDGKICKVSAESGHPVEWTEEENFIFRLSSLQKDLLYWLKDERTVQPRKFHRQVINWVEDGTLLQDVSVSRPKERVHWGVQVPNEASQTIYVWLEALVSYLTVAGYPDPLFCNVWPPDLQVIGKDILKFHGIYWPAFLIAAGLEPPRTLLCHSHWTVNQEKMSKSKQNVIDPLERMERYTASGLRYFLLREGTPHSDANFSDSKVTNILNSELADTLGNLLSRCCGTALNPLQIFPPAPICGFNKYCSSQETEELLGTISELPDIVSMHFEEYNFYKGINAITLSLHKANKFFQSQKPWELKRVEDQDKLNCILNITMESLRVCGLLLQPIVPDLCDILLTKLGIPASQRAWKDVRPFSWEQSCQRTLSSQRQKLVLYQRIVKN